MKSLAICQNVCYKNWKRRSLIYIPFRFRTTHTKTLIIPRMKNMTDEKSTPTDVEFTGEAPATHSIRLGSIAENNMSIEEESDSNESEFSEPPEIPNPEKLYFQHAMNTFHRYCLHMFEQFQNDTFALQRRVQIVEGLNEAYNEIIPTLTETLATHGLTNAHTIDRVLKVEDQVDKLLPEIIGQLRVQCDINNALIGALTAMREQLDNTDKTVDQIDDAVVTLQDKEWTTDPYPPTQGPPYAHDPTLTSVPSPSPLRRVLDRPG